MPEKANKKLVKVNDRMGRPTKAQTDVISDVLQKYQLLSICSWQDISIWTKQKECVRIVIGALKSFCIFLWRKTVTFEMFLPKTEVLCQQVFTNKRVRQC